MGRNQTLNNPRKTSKWRRVYNLDEIKSIAAWLMHTPHRLFNEEGNTGDVQGRLLVIGRGPEGESRLAAPYDEARHYHDSKNATQPFGGPYYVHTHPNQHQRSVAVIPDLSTKLRPGSPAAIYQRAHLVCILADVIMRLFVQAGTEVRSLMGNNFLIPGPQDNLSMIDTSPQLLQAALDDENPHRQSLLQAALSQLLGVQQYHTTYIISDLLQAGWEEIISQVAQTSELIIFQVIDPIDFELPKPRGITAIRQAGEVVEVNTNNQKVRQRYRDKTSERQAKFEQILKTAGVKQHYQLSTVTDLLTQLKGLVTPTGIQ